MKKIATLLVFVLMYKVGFSQWTNLNAPVIQERGNFLAIGVGDTGYIISGGGDFGYWSNADIFTRTNVQWSPLVNYPGGDNNGTRGFAIGDTIYAGTGAGGGYNYSNTFSEYNIHTQQWTGKTTSYNYQGRTSAVCFSIGDTGYTGGGLNSGYPTNNYSNNNPVNDFWRYVPATGVWDSIPHCPAKGVGCNAVAFVLNGKAYVGTGGIQDAPGSQTFDPVADFWCYDPATNQWDSITPFGGGVRMSAVAFVTCGHAYVGTGCIDNGQSVLVNDIWAFDPNGGPTGPNGPMGSWTRVSDFSGAGREQAGCFVIGTHAYIVCGLANGGNITYDDIWQYTPTPAFEANSPVCTGQQVQFSDTSLFFPDNYSWNFYGGTTPDSTVKNPIVTYNTPGTYWVTLTAWNDCDTGTTTDTNYITVKSGGLLTISPQSKQLCSGQSVTLTLSDTSGTFTWTPSAGLNDTTGDSAVATPSVTTTYTVTNADTSGCSSVGTDTIVVLPAPALLIKPRDTTICDGSSVTLFAPSSGSVYSWSPGATLSSAAADSVIATPTMQTTYTVNGTDSVGCAATGYDTVYVNKGFNKPIITDTSDLLTSTATQGNQWYRNGVVINGATDINYTATDTGCYYDIATNIANGCSSISNTLCLDTLAGINRLTINPNLLSIYPNPTGGEIFVNISSSVAEVKDWNLQIVDVLGRTVYTKLSLNYSNDIDLSNLSDGVYFITVINNSARAVVPVVKE